ncbi:MAG: T9SS type B sorting domain-containing protein [Chitinophagaceae bacterium]|nr:MAG: T9SS type B sorting domain-containing protein [Chitinophagaceae bacterium]
MNPLLRKRDAGPKLCDVYPFPLTLAPLLLAALKPPNTMVHRTLLWTFLFCIAAVLPARAQICTGALGDPIVNITFGAGSNPGPALSSNAVGGYQYISGDCPGDGFYGIRNSTVNCFASSWHNVTTDHTGDPGGYFMLVNASFSPGVFYQDTIRGLCSGTTYEFSAWVLNVLRTSSCGTGAVQPNLTFRIEAPDGTLLQAYNTGTINPSSSPEWRQFGLSFTTPPTVGSAVLRILNNAPGGCGNDLLLDDITFRACGPIMTPGFVGTAGTTQNICFGVAASPRLTVALSTGYNNSRFQWQRSVDNGPWTDVPGATTQSYDAPFTAGTAPGNYRFRLAVAEAANWGTATCTVYSPPLTVFVIARPPALSASNTGPACAGGSLELKASGASTYSWNGPGGFSATGSNVTLAPLDATRSGVYTVLATDSYNCSWSESTTVDVQPRPVAVVADDTLEYCQGAGTRFSASGGTGYEWQPLDYLSDRLTANPFANPPDSMTYRVIVTSGNCSDTATVQVNVWHRPEADAGPDRVLFLGDTLHLAGSVRGNDWSAAWTPSYFLPDPAALQTTAAPQQDTAYVLSVTSLIGCGNSSDTMRVRVFRRIEIPNVFTPNGDGHNDRWEVEALSAYRSYTVDLFNRYGQPVYHTENRAPQWDGTLRGKPLPAGTYYYVLRIGDTGQRLNGFVDLIR